MSSFVTDVLQSAGKLQREKLSVKVGNLTKHVDDVKDDVRDVLQKRYVEFQPSSIKTGDLVAKLETYDGEVKELTHIIRVELKEQLEASNTELMTICQQFRETTLALEVVHKFVKIHELLENSNQQFSEKDFVGAVKNFETLKSLVKDLRKEWGEHVSIIRGLQDDVIVRREKLMYDMIGYWNKCIVWQNNDEPQREDRDSNTDISCVGMTLSVELTSTSQDTYSSLIHGLHLFDHLHHLLKVFSARLMKHFITPIIAMPYMAEFVETETTVTLRLVKAAAKLSPEEVCKNLEQLLRFLHDNIFNVTINGEAHLMTELGHLLYRQIYEVMIKECLSPAVPSNKKEMARYNLVIESIVKLQDVMIQLRFVTEKDQSLLDYAKNVDTLIMNKMCRDKLAVSKELMARTLHEAAVVEDAPIRKLNLVVSPVERDTQAQGKCNIEDEYGTNSSEFSTCQVSKSTSELVNIIRSTVAEAMSSDEKCCIRLLCTARSIIELYLQVMPTIHKEQLESLPQQSALFYNNCMYLTHCLMTFGGSFKPKHGVTLKEAGITFADLLPQLRSLGTETFLAQLRSQRQLLLDNLNEAGKFQDLMIDINGVDSIENATKKCLLQLQRLRNVWTGVLPDNIFQKAIGTLLNSILEDFVNKLVVLEDISSDCASRLVRIFKNVQDKVPQLLQVSSSSSGCTESQIHKLVAKWLRFKLAIFLLDASLLDIDDHWADGKGPLASEFTAAEIKQIVQALFQNSSRRAVLLAKIK